MPQKPEISVLLFAGRFEVRGTSSYTLRLAEKLPEYGLTRSIVCSDARSVEPRQRSGLRITEYGQLTFPLFGRIVLEWVRRDLSEKPPDLIHIQSRSMLAAGSWLAAKLNRPFVLTLHDYLGPRDRFRFDRRYGKRIIAVSQSVKTELLKQTGLPDSLVTVIHSGVKPPVDVDLLPVLDPGHVPVIGTAGPLEAVKGIPFFLGAARRVLDERPDVQFLVAGAGPEESNLRRLARELKITSNVTFVSNLSDFSQSLAAMDIFVLPSLRQGLGTVMLEAMSLGKPVIATGVGGVYSVVRDNETGLVVPPSNSKHQAERILELLGDPVRARAIGESGRQLVQREFGVDRMVQLTSEVYRQALEESAAQTAAKTEST